MFEIKELKPTIFNPKQRHLLKKSAVVLVSVFLTACTNMSVGNLFSHYSSQNHDIHQLITIGQYQEALDQQQEGVAGEILDNFESGRVNFLAEHYEQSLGAFERSDYAIKEQQRQASLSLSQGVNSAGSLLTNDNMISYEPSDYELGFLHLYMSLNYLKNNDLSGALVEVRRANQVQEQAKKSRESDLLSAQESAKQKGVSPNVGAVLARYPDADGKLAKVQNGYLFYYSGLLYETSNSLNDAYVDYKRALAVAPDNQAVIDATIRTARKLGMSSDLKLLKQQYSSSDSLASNQSRVIIIDEQGTVEALKGWKQPLPMYDSHGNTAIYNLALPVYPNITKTAFSPLLINDKKVSSQFVVDTNGMAKNDLYERLPAIVIRQALRIFAKDSVRKQTRGSSNEDIGNLLINIFNTLTEQPDTRNWQSLPAQVSVSSMNMEAGTQTISYAGKELTFTVETGRTVLVWMSRQGSSVTWWHKQLGEM